MKKRYFLVAGVILPMLLFLLFFVCIFTVQQEESGEEGEGGQGNGGGAYGNVGVANVSAECERYRPLVEKYAKSEGLEEFVEIIMCIMMQESGGRVPDVMQCSECPFNMKYPQRPQSITDPEYSIQVGIKNFKFCLQNAGCTSIADMDGVKLALQDYNFGNGYASWARANYGGYTQANASEFSNIQAARHGWNGYGDPYYVDHVLCYYTYASVGESASWDGIENEEAILQLEGLQQSWPDMDERRKSIIAKGASLIGKVTYSMGAGRDDPSDHPTVKDCSSFVAWAYQKAGFTDVPYWSATGTFIGSANFQQISQSELLPGDVGLINTIAFGGSNHIGIYVGRDVNNMPMWLHCTSHASPGCVTVTDGPRISYYTSFTIFYRYVGFKD